MNIDKAVKYNANGRGTRWDPRQLPITVLGHVIPHPDDVSRPEFAEAVANAQRALGLVVDGMLGPTTWRAVTVVGNGRALPGGMLMLDGQLIATAPAVIRTVGLKGRKRESPPTQVVMHVDVSFDSARTYDILRAKGFSSHFGVDGDKGVDGFSTIHQWLDPGRVYGLHAGEANRRSIGIDVNTPLDLKYARRDARRRGRERPVVKAVVRGRERENLGFFPEQIASLALLAKFFEDFLGIPARFPTTNGKPISYRWDGAFDYHGWVAHYMFDTSHYCPGAAGLVAVPEFLRLEDV